MKATLLTLIVGCVAASSSLALGVPIKLAPQTAQDMPPTPPPRTALDLPTTPFVAWVQVARKNMAIYLAELLEIKSKIYPILRAGFNQFSLGSLVLEVDLYPN